MEATSTSDSVKKHSVFVSHKVNDRTVTNCLKELLDSHTENITFFVSEDIQAGAPWRKTIAERLKGAGFLVLVFTDPKEDWGWCLYETGFFDALSQIPDSKLARSIWCLHNASTPPPSPIADLQTVPATNQAVEKWLSELFERTNQTKEVFRNAIPKLADEICKLFINSQKPIYSQRSIDIVVDCTLLTSPDDLPDGATIHGDPSLMGELFGTYDNRTNWKSVKERFDKSLNSVEVNNNTLKEISRAVYDIYKKNIVHPIQGIIFVDQGPKRYRPIISCAKELTRGRVSCEILLLDEGGGPLQNIDKALGALLTSIRIAARIRWEIIRPFTSDVRDLAQVDPKKLRFDLQTCLNNIFLEAEFRSHFSWLDLLKAFDNPERAKMREINAAFDRVYPKIWQGIGFSNVKETFGEVSDKPMTSEDLSLIESGLQELERLNKDFLAIAAPRAELLIQRELTISSPPIAPAPQPTAAPAKTAPALDKPQ
jgi:hypothetical protein